jgi:hypothetical protein
VHKLQRFVMIPVVVMVLAAGLDGRLLALQAANPQLVLLDPPAAVRALQHREAMLAPLAGQPLLLQPQMGLNVGLAVVVCNATDVPCCALLVGSCTLLWFHCAQLKAGRVAAFLKRKCQLHARLCRLSCPAHAAAVAAAVI